VLDRTPHLERAKQRRASHRLLRWTSTAAPFPTVIEVRAIADSAISGGRFRLGPRVSSRVACRATPTSRRCSASMPTGYNRAPWTRHSTSGGPAHVRRRAV
jgi:hypothetical protein